jgi:hypothetical protein
MVRRTTRSWSRIAVAATTFVLLGAGAPVTGPATFAGGATVACDPVTAPHSSARVIHGSEAADPSTVTARQAAVLERRLQHRLTRMRSNGKVDADGRLVARKNPYHVDTYVHVITPAEGGGATEEQVLAQMDVLNKAFRGAGSKSARTPFRFVLKGIDYTANDEWYEWSIDFETGEEGPGAIAAQDALHVGGYDTLNIYVTGLVDTGLLGYATLPGYPDETPVQYDGLVLLDASLPGGGMEPYNLGDTATHEIGHWLGLLHTFDNGCASPGDYVSDTPYQLDGDNIYECNERDDTCRQPGRDPVHNFMSYGDDTCLDRFTAGQAWRMTRAWAAFRYQQ